VSVIRATGLVKRYGDVTALDGFDLTLEPGRIVGLIGPNGSGKTTAIKSLLGMCKLDGGDLSVLGFEPYAQRAALMQRAAYIADTGILPRWMKVCELIDVVAGLHASFDADKAIHALEATDVRLEKRVKTLSKGMNVQLHLALILAIDSQLLVLDEPTLGLDILYRQHFYDAVLGEYYNEQRSILITTHEVREIEHVLTDVVFIHRGRVRLAASMEALADQFVKVTTAGAGDKELRRLSPIGSRKTLQGVEYILQDADREEVSRYGSVSTPNLAELFVALVGDRASQEAV
jgi:ABC-2 type transport system ATP-binding protein